MVGMEMNESAAPFGSWLERLTPALDLTQEDLARQVGYSVSAIRKVEAAELLPSKQLAEKLAEHLDVPRSGGRTFCALPRARPSLTEPEPEPRGIWGTSTTAGPQRLPPPATFQAPLTSFIGRAPRAGRGWRRVEVIRLVTLVGAGGCGKTRLAGQVAADFLEDYARWGLASSGARVLDRSVARPRSVLFSALGIHVGIRSTDGGNADRVPAPARGSARGRQLRAPDRALRRHLIETLMRACPRSRDPRHESRTLTAPGKQSGRCPSLDLPGRLRCAPGRTSGNEAVTPVRRAGGGGSGAVSGDRQERWCGRRVCCQARRDAAGDRAGRGADPRAAQVEQILTRLDDRFALSQERRPRCAAAPPDARQPVDWSHDLLSDAEQTLARHLAVFPGGWTLGADRGGLHPGGRRMTSVLGGMAGVLDLLTQVVDKSLVSCRGADGQVRYRMLETVRQYLDEKLRAAGEDEAICARRLRVVPGLTEESTDLQRFHRAARLDRLEVEHDNLRAALAWSLANDVENGLRLAARMWGVWLVRGYGAEGCYWAEALLARAPRPECFRRRASVIGSRCCYGIGRLRRGPTPGRASARPLSRARPTRSGGPGRSIVRARTSRVVERGSPTRRGTARGSARAFRGHAGPSWHWAWRWAAWDCRTGAGAIPERPATVRGGPGARARDRRRELRPRLGAAVFRQAGSRGRGDDPRNLPRLQAGCASFRRIGDKARHRLVPGVPWVSRGSHREPYFCSTISSGRVCSSCGRLAIVLRLAMDAVPPGKRSRQPRHAHGWGTPDRRGSHGASRLAVLARSLVICRDRDRHEEASPSPARAEDRFTDVWAKGQALTLEQAIAYALADDEDARVVADLTLR